MTVKLDDSSCLRKFGFLNPIHDRLKSSRQLVIVSLPTGISVTGPRNPQNSATSTGQFQPNLEIEFYILLLYEMYKQFLAILKLH